MNIDCAERLFRVNFIDKKPFVGQSGNLSRICSQDLTSIMQHIDFEQCTCDEMSASLKVLRSCMVDRISCTVVHLLSSKPLSALLDYQGRVLDTVYEAKPKAFNVKEALSPKFCP